MSSAHTVALPATGQAVKLVSRAAGLPGPGCFALVDEPLPAPGPGKVLVRNLAFRINASVRMFISEDAAQAPGVPFPVLEPGQTLVGSALGEVVAAPGDGPLQVGDTVVHRLGWREYSAVPAAACIPVPAGSDPAVVLGEGWTAYAALVHGARLQPGETVFVSSGSSAMGVIAGQVARLLGAARVVTSTGSAEKAARLVGELGYDAAVLRDDPRPIAVQLAEAAPDGVDVVLDTVGGEQLAAALDVARDDARIVVVGALSGQLAEAGNGLSAPVTIDSAQIVFKRLSLIGYSADADAEAEQEWIARQAEWIRDGRLRIVRTAVPGLEAATPALLDVMSGKHLGTVIVELAAAREDGA